MDTIGFDRQKKENNKMNKTFYRSLITNKILDNTDVDSVCNNCEEVLNVILQQHLGKSYTYSK